MPLTEEQIRKLPHYAQPFWRAALAFVQATKTDWVEIKPNTDEIEAWKRYFQSKGWKPFAIAMIEQGRLKSIVMPAKWPEWFEPTWAATAEAAE